QPKRSIPLPPPSIRQQKAGKEPIDTCSLPAFISNNSYAIFPDGLDMIDAEKVLNFLVVLCIPQNEVRLLPHFNGADNVLAANSACCIVRRCSQRFCRG